MPSTGVSLAAIWSISSCRFTRKINKLDSKSAMDSSC